MWDRGFLMNCGALEVCWDANLPRHFENCASARVYENLNTEISKKVIIAPISKVKT